MMVESYSLSMQIVLLYTVALVFSVSAITKLLDLNGFRTALLSLPYMRYWLSYLIAFTLPFIELALALGLVANSVVARFVSCMLLFSFIVVSIMVILKKVHVECSCFGALGGDALGRRTIRRNVLLLLAIVLTFGIEIRAFHPRELMYTIYLLVLLTLVAQVIQNRQRILIALRS